jgi:hypothetical protein
MLCLYGYKTINGDVGMYISSRKIDWFFPLPTIVRNPNPDWGIAFLWRVYWFCND